MIIGSLSINDEIISNINIKIGSKTCKGIAINIHCTSYNCFKKVINTMSNDRYNPTKCSKSGVVLNYFLHSVETVHKKNLFKIIIIQT